MNVTFACARVYPGVRRRDLLVFAGCLAVAGALAAAHLWLEHDHYRSHELQVREIIIEASRVTVLELASGKELARELVPGLRGCQAASDHAPVVRWTFDPSS